jgi:STE24 endopeptidase
LANEDKATRYHRLRRRAAVLGTALSACFLVVFLVTGASAALRESLVRITGEVWPAAVLAYTVVLAIAHELLLAPASYYQGITLERRYGLSTQTTAGWWRDYLKAGGLSLAFAAGAALMVWSLIRWNPATWWLAAAAVFAAVLVVLAQLAPLLLLPLFYELKPLDREGLRHRLLALADRSGTRVVGVFEWRLSDRTRKANAAFTGLGRTRRILLSDTLLGEYSDDEMEVILAHELAHQVHRDIWSGIAVEASLIVVALYAADLALTTFQGAFGLAGKSDIAALPVLVLTGGLATLVLRPVANALSRAHERRADRYALDMTRNAPAFVSAMRRLAAQNLAEERPSRLVELMFYTHPPTVSRIDAARAWAARHAPTT